MTAPEASDRRPPVHLSSIAYTLGNEVTLATLAEDIVRQQLANLRREGLAHCRVSDLPVASLAAHSARQTIDRSPDQPVDAIVYCTDTPPELTTTSDAWDFLLELGQPTVPVTVVGGAGCGNVGPGLRTACSLIRAEGLSTVLLVTADRVRSGTRYLANGQTVLSDGAASCLVSSEPHDPSLRVAGLGSSFQVDIGTTTTRPIVVAKATAAHIRATVDRTLASLSRTVDDVRFLLSGNYGRSAQRFLAMNAGVSLDRVYSPFRARVGHCFAADALLSLASLLDQSTLANDDLILLLTMSPRSWSVAAITYADGTAT